MILRHHHIDESLVVQYVTTYSRLRYLLFSLQIEYWLESTFSEICNCEKLSTVIRGNSNDFR